VSLAGIKRALRNTWRPALWILVAGFVALLMLAWNVAVVGVFGFDFEGTIWEPARSVLHGHSPYPPPTRAAVELGNPAVYPPFVAVVTAPLGLLSLPAAKAVWTLSLIAGFFLALRIAGVRDWRCYVAAAAALPVLEGLFWGNLTLLLLVPVALAWRYRDSAPTAGVAVGAAVAAKLFLWPLVVWLLLTRRYRAAAWAAASAVVLVATAWAAIGFDGLADYPALLRVLDDVYSVRSFSLATLTFVAGVPQALAVAFGALAGVALLVLAAWLVRRPDGDRRSFAVAVAASLVASPIVWPYYMALLFVPVAITWARLAPAWFFGQVLILFAVTLPAYSLPQPEPCCRPPDVPRWVWTVSQTFPAPWQATGMVAVLMVVTFAVARRPRFRRPPSNDPAASSALRAEPVPSR
jgi:hypothetical protein